jgi:hypothetical protein
MRLDNVGRQSCLRYSPFLRGCHSQTSKHTLATRTTGHPGSISFADELSNKGAPTILDDYIAVLATMAIKHWQSG